jgi:hypothetical protein
MGGLSSFVILAQPESLSLTATKTAPLAPPSIAIDNRTNGTASCVTPLGNLAEANS